MRTKRNRSLSGGESQAAFRDRALRGLTNQIGVYAICDLDGVPIYVGQSVAGIRERVRRHTTSARSDIIANSLIDVWEIAYIKAWPVTNKSQIASLEAALFHFFDKQKPLMNGTIPKFSGKIPSSVPDPAQIVRVMSEEDIKIRLEPALRLPRQILHLGRLIDYILNVKDASHLRRSLSAHFARLDAYRAAFLGE